MKNIIYFSIFLSLLTLSFIACSSKSAKEDKTKTDTLNSKKVSDKKSISLNHDTTLVIAGIPVDIAMPVNEATGSILILNGWNFSRDNCCKNSSFCKQAKERNYCLIMPEMGKSVYSKEIYPETRSDWRKYPTRTWLIDSMIPALQRKFNLLVAGNKNYVFGISTGARGVALTVLHTKNIFLAGAALSGDYEQTQMTTDNLMIGFYGSYQAFPDRWKGDENPLMSASKYNTPLYIGHGLKDHVVPYVQSKLFYQELKKQKPNLDVVFHTDSTADHNYKYWDSETQNVLNFFDKHKN